MQTRRRLLQGIAGAATTGIAGCTAFAEGPPPVTILGAGSLTTALENGLRPAVDHPVRVGTRGSAAIARLVASGTRSPDILSLADPALFDTVVSTSWYATFATNAMVLAYTTATPGGRTIADAGPDRWWEPLLEESIRFGRTDPALDPLGYRSLFTLELAGTYYDDAPPLRSQIPNRSHVYPETQLLAQFETGGLDAALTYRNMAEERGYDYHDLPAEIDLGNPHYRDRYQSTSYTLPGGTTVTGDVIQYAATILNGADRDPVKTVFDYHTRGGYLAEYGFDRPDDYPRFIGDVPRNLEA